MFGETHSIVSLTLPLTKAIRRVNAGPATATRDTVRKSYEFALSHVGQDKDSGEIWRDYIQFLRVGEAHTTWEEQQKMDALRKVYHRAVQIPLDNVEALWQELEAFETGLNRITAKKFMADLSPAHMQARTTLRQLVNHLATLFPPPQVRPLCSSTFFYANLHHPRSISRLAETKSIFLLCRRLTHPRGR